MHLLLILFTAFATDFVVWTQNSVEPSEKTEDLDLGEPLKMRRLYDEFKQTYSRGHTGEEDERRFNIFRENMHKAKLLQETEQGTAEYGITEFSDMTENEFSRRCANLKLSSKDWINQPRVYFDPQGAPKSIDWSKLGAVSTVQDQGQCGSCWAFSAIGAIEGQWYRKSGKLIKLSEQQLMDCDPLSYGCDGGDQMNAFNAVRKMGGVQTAASYPYIHQKRKCLTVPSKFVAYINTTVRLSANETVIAGWLAAHGPVSVSINDKPLPYYKRGIMHPTAANCDMDNVTHAVLAVGYGVENSVPYWIIKNSHGANWGEHGYLRIYRGDGTCGIDRDASAVEIK